MSESGFDAAEALLREALERLRTPGAAPSEDELLAVLRASRSLERLVEQVRVEAVAAMDRGGMFAARGYRRPESVVANLLTVERLPARRVVRAAGAVCRRLDPTGAELPARLPAAATAFAAGAATVRHIDVIAAVLDGPAARQLTAEARAAVEQQTAAVADEYTPSELAAWANRLVEAHLREAADSPDGSGNDTGINELRISRRPGGGGRIDGRFDDPVRFQAVLAVLDAKAAPLNAEDDRTSAQRNADALVEVCEFVATHAGPADLPSAGGERPQVSVVIRLDDLQRRASAARLDFGGTPSPGSLRMLCCDASVVPIVLGGTSQPLDVGRSDRTIPDGLRRAVRIRDRGCAHPGCDRPPSWCQIHHIVPWSHGGATRLDNVVMLCRVHHREIHTTGWSVRISPDGQPEFQPPRWIDRRRRVARRPHHRPTPPVRPEPPSDPDGPDATVRMALPDPEP